MISVIICSVNKELLNNISKNIAATIGVDHEIITIDNNKNNYGISKAYNIGAGQSRFPNLCFVHEDVIFETANWGKIVIDYLKDDTVGLIGIAGASYKSDLPTSWSAALEYCYKNLIQEYKHSANDAFHDYINPGKEPTADVVVLDGVFLCCRKTTWQSCRFDEKMGGFHGYDIDFSLQVGQKVLKRLVIFDLLIRHFSEGKPDINWINSAEYVSKKWKNILPLSLDALSFSTKKQLYWLAVNQMIDRSLENNMVRVQIISNFIKWLQFKYLDIVKAAKCLKKIIFYQKPDASK